MFNSKRDSLRTAGEVRVQKKLHYTVKQLEDKAYFQEWQRKADENSVKSQVLRREKAIAAFMAPPLVIKNAGNVTYVTVAPKAWYKRLYYWVLDKFLEIKFN